MGDPKAPPLQVEMILGLLAEHAVDYVIVGGLAAVASGASRVTFDIDVVPEWTDENLDRLAAALNAAGARLRIPKSAAIEFPIDARALRQSEVSTWRTMYGDVDVIIGTPTAERGVLADYRRLVGKASAREAFGVVVQIADLEDVIQSKQALAREPDLAALPELYRLRDALRQPPNAG